MTNCHSVSKKISNKSGKAFAKKYSSVLGFLMLLVPKCPLCIAAYSGAVAICGSSTLITHSYNTNYTDWRAYIALGVSIGITGCILFTFRARQNYTMTLVLALSGLLLICIGLTPGSSVIFKTGTMTCYYLGAALLLAATFIYSGIHHKLFERLKISGFAN
jgi:peptidoglycan/LPS O-acetylase OafA/YrhL